MSDHKQFKLNKITLAVLLSLGSPASVHLAHAGAGWGDNIDITGAPIKVQTFYANSPSGLRPDPLGGTVVDPATGSATPLLIDTGTALRKFVDALPGLGEAKANLLGQYIPIGSPEKWVDGNGNSTADDYYEIAVVEYSEKMHSDLVKPTRLRGYVQLSTPTNPGKHLPLSYPDGTPILDRSGAPVFAVDKPHYLGPLIVAQRGTAVRIKFTNYLPLGLAGDLFIPVDKTLPGAGLGPDGLTSYTENRAAVHWHGGDTPWISDGTPHQWIAPAGETTAYATVLDANGTTMGKGVSSRNVPDMPDPGPGSTTLYFPNNLSARLMFYHDHSLGLTRLNVYAGMAAGYLIQDPVEQALVSSGQIPAEQIPLVIQDKTFVPKDIAQQDAKWDTTHWGQEGDLWFPHVYETNQDPNSIDGTNPVGRWDWGPWFWPVFPAQYSLPSGGYGDASTTPEAFMDTPVINGTAYPTLSVEPKAYRFRVLNAANDRFINLNLFKTDPTIPVIDPVSHAINPGFDKEVKMVAAIPNPSYPPTWPTDGRAGGVPDPSLVGPAIIQIGNEGGILPKPVVIPPQPVTYEANRRSITVLNVLDHGLYMGPAERADIIVDFSPYAGQTLILYNDAPAPVPAFDPRIDYFTGNGDQTGEGGAHDTLPGYGPNTRTMLQIKVQAIPQGGTATPAFNLNALNTALPAAYGASQERPVVPESVYNAAFGTADADNYGKIATGSITQPNFNWTPTSPGQTISSITLTSGGTGYTSTPTVVFNGGVDLTVPGNAKASATATVDPVSKKISGLTLTSPGSGYTSAPQITFSGGGGIGATASVATSATVSLPVQNKAIQELFEPIYGRMNATLGVELPFTSALTQTTIPLGYVDPATESIADNETQIWKITHNGVDTHPVHFHLVNVQVINRVGWDGTVKPPADNEQGWKETVKMNPLEDILVAVKAKRPLAPFGLPQSSRPMDPSQPLGSTLGFTQIDPQTNNPRFVANAIAQYDNEYVWHCHILGHEENDFMRPFLFHPNDVLPSAPSNLGVDQLGNLDWIDPTPAGLASTKGNPQNEIGFKISRATAGGAFAEIGTALANATKWSDPGFVANASYSYRIVAYNAAGDGPPSNIAADPVPNAPSALISTSVSATQVALAWTDNSLNETGFTVWRDGLAIGSTAADVTTFLDSTVAESTTYVYTVVAVNAVGSSAPSNALSLKTPVAPPLAPSGLSATASAAGVWPAVITLNWVDAATNETSYTLQRQTTTTGSCNPNGVWATLTSLAANSTAYIDTTATFGNAYCYQVQAVNASGVSAWSMTTGPATLALAVAAPTALTATPNTAGSSIALRWTDRSTNETAYLVEQSTDGTTFATLATINRSPTEQNSVNGTLTLAAPSTPGNLYTFRVTALNVSAGVTTASPPVSVSADLRAPAAPATPSALSARLTSATQATLSWQDNANSETSYLLEVSTDGGAFVQLAVLGRSTAQKLSVGSRVNYNTRVFSGHTYTYQVKAIATAYGQSTPSASSAPAALSTLAPDAPINPAAIPGAPGSIVVYWTDASNNESGFTIQRRRVVAGIPGIWSNAGAVAAGVTVFTNSGLSRGAVYQYQVRANGVVGNSPYVGPTAGVTVP
ncbi:MAG: Fibronectin type domain protein [Proteobacteria bacterium]|nr:Fibronectin type domain protein [Pseudomonadota bacterium]